MYISETVWALLASVPISHTAAVVQAPASTASALLEGKNGVESFACEACLHFCTFQTHLKKRCRFSIKLVSFCDD